MGILLISYTQALHRLASGTVGKTRTSGASFAAEVVLVFKD